MDLVNLLSTRHLADNFALVRKQLMEIYTPVPDVECLMQCIVILLEVQHNISYRIPNRILLDTSRNGGLFVVFQTCIALYGKAFQDWQISLRSAQHSSHFIKTALDNLQTAGLWHKPVIFIGKLGASHVESAERMASKCNVLVTTALDESVTHIVYSESRREPIVRVVSCSLGLEQRHTMFVLSKLGSLQTREMFGLPPKANLFQSIWM